MTQAEDRDKDAEASKNAQVDAETVDPVDAAEAASRAIAALWGTAASGDGAADAALEAAAEPADEPAAETQLVAEGAAAEDAGKAAAADEPATERDPNDPVAHETSEPADPDLTVPMAPDEADAAEATARALASLNVVDGFDPALESAPLKATIHRIESKMAADATTETEARAGEGAASADPDRAALPDDDETTLLPQQELQASTTNMLPDKLRHPRTVDETITYYRPGESPLRVDQAERERRAHRHLHAWQKALIGVVILGAVAGGSYGAYRLWQVGQQAEAKQEAVAEHTLMNVVVPVKISGLSTSAESSGEAVGSKIPLQVSGQDSTGAVVDEVQFVDEKGQGMRLLPGDYTIFVAASPIAADGTVYTVPGEKLDIKVHKDNQDYAAAGTLKFEAAAADAVTEAQISQAYKLAAQGGAPSEAIAGILKQAAEARRSAAVSATAAQSKELLKEADARHKATPSYSFDLPQAWYGHVTTAQNGDAVYVYLSGSQTLVCKLTVQKDGFAAGDATDGVLGSASLGGGESVVVSGPAYPWVVMQTALGKTQASVDTYPEATAVELVQLQTGGTYTFEQIKAGIAGKDAQEADYQKLVQDYLGQVLLPSIKAR